MKKIIISLLALVAAGLIAWGAFTLGTKHDSSDDSSSSKTSTSISKKKSSGTSTDDSTSVTGGSSTSSSQKHSAFGGQGGGQPSTPSTTDVNTAKAQLKAAGFPVDEWAPSDIEKIISDAQQQGISVVDYANQNYHK
ncbi:hypothetical protein H7198_01220 [Fructobacillus sp. CRL 2054]|uniref:hypothetical protein n=1 Tax=Fructobacillus sp. CRL 2054 TaxID=2763007 RepID=UPI002377D697|nr:hypothetical protein [Fructobacillus sp. CRL 2054]MDD9138232.1 hypothetical protein [Fructobacillus sp. CRL 2054]